MTHFTFFGGKGGVGKTTCAAAAAVRAAALGSRVLIVSTDPAHSLADAFAVKLKAAPTRVRPMLSAAQLDADRALDRWLREREGAFRTIAERGTYLDEEDIERLFSLSLPGVDELVGLLELARLARTESFDAVVVDTAPTGHTVRLLEMPETLRRFAEVLDDMHAKHRFLASSLGGKWRPDAADEAIAEVERDAEGLREMLSSRARSSLTWVTLPEELAVDESERGVRAVEALGLHVDRIVVNRVWLKPDRPCPRCTPRVASEASCLRRIARVFVGRTLLEVPAAAAEPRGENALAKIAASVKRLEVPDEGAARVRRTSSNEHASLRLPESARLVFFGGKGGVGKSTAACAAAIEIASKSKGKNVLLLSTDPAHSLGDALDAKVGDAPVRVPGAPANLVVRELDARAAFEAERDKYKGAIDELFGSIFRGRMDASYDRAVLQDLVDLAPPGLDELFALVSIVDAVIPKKREYDLVVVDTAPTGHTLRLLGLPPAALAWVHAIMQIILKYRRVVGLGELASDLTNLARRLRALIEVLADPTRCAFVAVARPAELPRLETERLVHALRKLRVPLAAILVNAVVEPTCRRCSSDARIEAPEVARLVGLARRAKSEVVAAPAVFPPPRGPRAIAAWRSRWHAVAL